MKFTPTMLKTLFDESPSLNAIISPHGIIFDVNQSFVKLSGLEKSQLIDQPYWDLQCWVHSEEMQNRILFALEESAITKKAIRFEAQYKDYKGLINDLDLRILAVLDAQENIQYFVAFGYNVTELVSARRALSNNERQLRALFEYSKDGYVFNILPTELEFDLQNNFNALINDSIRYLRIIAINASMRDILGLSKDVDIKSLTFYNLLKLSGPLYRKSIETILSKGEYRFEHRLINQNGEPKVLEITLSIIKDQMLYYGFFAVVRDLTIQKAYEAELEFYAHNDPLTGLRNRRYYFNQLENRILNSETEGFFCMFDIDHFKSINDNYGHDTGDQVLIIFSEVAKKYFSKVSEVCRYGGEEFLTFIPWSDEDQVFKFVDAFRVEISQIQFDSDQNTKFSITVSIGIAHFHHSDTQPSVINQAISRADKALYHSKHNGRNQVTVCILSGDGSGASI